MSDYWKTTNLELFILENLLHALRTQVKVAKVANVPAQIQCVKKINKVLKNSIGKKYSFKKVLYQVFFAWERQGYSFEQKISEFPT